MTQLIKSLPGWLKLMLIFPIFFLNGVLLSLIINRFRELFDYIIIATLVTFLLKLTINFLVSKGIGKRLAIFAVITISFALIALGGITLIPLMGNQLGNLSQDIPRWLSGSQEHLANLKNSTLFLTLDNAGVNVDDLFQKAYLTLSKELDRIGQISLKVLTETIGGVVDTLVILVLTIFLLVGGDTFWQGILSWLPSPWEKKIPQYAGEIFRDYFISRLILAAGSSMARLVVFMALGIPYSILFAFSLGLASLIPFAGAVVTLIGTLVLLLKGWVVAVKFFVSAIVIDQITDNGVAPKLMGDKIGLNPVWILISIFIGAEIAGLLGVLLAVPIASVIKKVIDDMRAGKTENEEIDTEEQVEVLPESLA
ncbi:sll1166 [Synechocystis sp. PCC 6803]|jgi:predicted PurR-regulated permease PerM|uniref:Sll1166 protein n=1 Tax=Synechocystis sp. (strain ATCC 27184 / PCC 6803 / Kazusa) TaxID=1111708 RepID=P74204_SYNY3|nr:MULTISPECIES: AI-2E family transporter [unclassified Synechocystis]AGF51983.1 hypothetical protein MYO_117380 [Synechocystis sp. PCC 6803]ALJ67947.1 hypothetical protein AOY38_08930 [Synechocystis sp. PCC 6803]AVP89780.1 AI-2E family transporter [Synechocystis sp. IPPAS B-1465]MBD2619196.1 AI-2E family transporter [Synechocystis sp. FACHB-898]MBD2639582.1 AI-2E family transporter [Synechocystis sp. FACHB-908]